MLISSALWLVDYMFVGVNALISNFTPLWSCIFSVHFLRIWTENCVAFRVCAEEKQQEISNEEIEEWRRHTRPLSWFDACECVFYKAAPWTIKPIMLAFSYRKVIPFFPVITMEWKPIQVRFKLQLLLYQVIVLISIFVII